MGSKNKIIWTRHANKQLLKIDRRYIPKIEAQARQLENFPNVELDIKDLKGIANKYRLRIGIYRVIFEVIDGVPRIIAIQSVSKRSERTYA